MLSSVKKKAFDITTWEYRERKHKIEVFIQQPAIILFDMGFYLEINPKTYKTSTISWVQKQLRQYLFNYLDGNGHKTDSYILILEGSAKPTGNRTFIDLKMTCPSVGEMEQNKAFCETITDKMYQLLEK